MFADLSLSTIFRGLAYLAKKNAFIVVNALAWPIFNEASWTIDRWKANIFTWVYWIDSEIRPILEGSNPPLYLFLLWTTQKRVPEEPSGNLICECNYLRKSKQHSHLFASLAHKPSHSTTSNIITSHPNILHDPPSHQFVWLINKPSHSTTSSITTSPVSYTHLTLPTKRIV